MRALNLIRHGLVYRREVFTRGLQAVGFTVVDEPFDPRPEDLLCCWQRYGQVDHLAMRFEQAGARVIVCENGLWGKHWNQDNWISMGLNHIAGPGYFRVGGPERWDSLGITLRPLRAAGTELVILGQRGIGEPGIASPYQWAETMQQRIGGRIRKHPGNEPPAVTLEDDLKDAYAVATWASNAALRALALGVPVWYGFDRWIGREASTPLALAGERKWRPRSDDRRLAMFRKIIWANWTLAEIGSGQAVHWLLEFDRLPEAA